MKLASTLAVVVILALAAACHGQAGAGVDTQINFQVRRCHRRTREAGPRSVQINHRVVANQPLRG